MVPLVDQPVGQPALLQVAHLEAAVVTAELRAVVAAAVAVEAIVVVVAAAMAAAEVVDAVDAVDAVASKHFQGHGQTLNNDHDNLE